GGKKHKGPLSNSLYSVFLFLTLSLSLPLSFSLSPTHSVFFLTNSFATHFFPLIFCHHHSLNPFFFHALSLSFSSPIVPLVPLCSAGDSVQRIKGATTPRLA